MAIGSLTNIKLMLGITDSSSDTLLQLFLTASDAAVRSYIRRGSSRTIFANYPESGADTWYGQGENRPDLIFPFGPITTLTSVYLDLQGYGNQGVSPFAAATLLTAGRDYMLVNDDGTSSAKAVIRRLGGLNTGGIWGEYGWAPFGTRSTSGPLAMGGREVAGWPSVPGCLKIVCQAGFTSIPADLAMAANQLAIFMYRTRQYGMGISSESLGAYSVSFLTNPKIPELGTARQLLARFRSDLPI